MKRIEMIKRRQEMLCKKECGGRQGDAKRSVEPKYYRVRVNDMMRFIDEKESCTNSKNQAFGVVMQEELPTPICRVFC